MAFSKMDKTIKAKWLKELFSGKHKQTRGMLKSCVGGMCCLGVLCNAIDPNGWQDYFDEYAFVYKGDDHTHLLPSSLKAEAKIDSSAEDFLTKLNDNRHWNFKQIGKWIEENL